MVMAKSVVFFVARFSYSGVPLAQIRLAKALVRRGHKVQIVFGFVPPDIELPGNLGVKVLDLNCPRVLGMVSAVFKYIRDEKPDVIFSAEDHLNAIIAFCCFVAGSQAKISASSRVTPYDTYSENILSKGWILKKMSQLAKKRINVHTCVSKDMVDQYKNVLGAGDYRCIYNVVVDEDFASKMAEEVEETWIVGSEIPLIVSAGRLAPEKGFSDLIHAMHILLKKRAALLLILGDGPLRQELEDLIEDKGLSDNVFLIGHQSNPLKYFSRSSVFVLSSYVEGLPNVLVEAMACGCTPVSTNCPTGPSEVLRGGEYGYLVSVGKPNEIADAIAKALDNPISGEKLRLAVSEFTEEAVLEQHYLSLGFSD